MPRQMPCPKCGASVYLTDAQCLSCGARLDAGQLAGAPPVSAPTPPTLPTPPTVSAPTTPDPTPAPTPARRRQPWRPPPATVLAVAIVLGLQGLWLLGYALVKMGGGEPSFFALVLCAGAILFWTYQFARGRPDAASGTRVLLIIELTIGVCLTPFEPGLGVPLLVIAGGALGASLTPSARQYFRP